MDCRLATRAAAALALLHIVGSGCGGGAPGGAGGGVGGGGSGGGGAGAAMGDCAAVDFSAFDTAVTTFLGENGLSGASGVVVHARCGMMHARGYGQHAAERVYLVGSASKIVSVGVLLRLMDEGRLDIDAPIGVVTAAWGPDGKPELEVAQLVSNSSGLVGLIDNPLYRPYACQYRDAGSLADCARAIYTADDAATRVPPDTSFHYGGGQWQLAGGVAEAISGRRWADLVAATYGQACALSVFGYTNQFAKAAGAGLSGALTYPSFFGGDAASLPPTDNPSVEGGLYTTAADYGKILLMHLRGGVCDRGRVLSEGAVQRMRRDRILDVYGGTTAGQMGRVAGGSGGGGLEGYGLGWWIDRAHPGVFADPGLYGAFPWIDLGRGYGALVAIESDGDVGARLWATIKPRLDETFDRAALRLDR